MRVADKIKLITLQGKPEIARSAIILKQEVIKRSAAIKLARLVDKLNQVSAGDKDEKH